MNRNENADKYVKSTFIIGATLCLLFAGVNFLLHNFMMAAVETVLSLFAIGSFLCVSSVRKASRLALGASVILLLSLLVSGGVQHSGLSWFPFFPAIAFFWLGTREGIRWSIGMLLLVLVSVWLSVAGYVELAFSPSAVLMSLVSSSTVGIIVYFYERYREQDSAELEYTIEELSGARAVAELNAKAKGDFLASMSHEIRTPLNGVVGMSSILLQSPLEPNQKETAAVIHDSATILLSLINNILDFSRLEAGCLEIERNPFCMQELCGELIRMVAPPAYEKNVEILFDIDSAIPNQLMGDKKHLRQVLINLVGNAVKFTSKGHVSMQVKRVGTCEKGVRVRFKIRDTGMGISEEQQKVIFSKYGQADTSEQGNVEGHGLGLAIASRLTHMMDSQIEIESELGEGSLFSFEVIFPPAPAKDHSPAKTLKGQRALIIESYLPLSEVLKKQLLRADASVTVSSGARIAETLVAAKKADIILLDVNFQQDPLKLAMIISASAPKKPRIYLLKSASDVLDSAQLTAANISSVITKPVLGRDLTDRLARVEVGSASALPEHAPDQRARRVLLVEDNFVNQKVACHFLERCNCTVELANDGAQGAAAAMENDFDFIFMDCQMPVMDGYDSTRAIRAAEVAAGQGRRTPIIALTAHAMDSDRDKCLAAGMDEYLTKPIDSIKLEKIIAAYS